MPGWRHIAALLGLAAVTAASLAAYSAASTPASDGPLSQDVPTTTGLPFGAGRDGTFGVWLPRNPTAAPITIDRVEVVGAIGLVVLGQTACLPDPPGVGIGTAAGFPPSSEGAPAGSPGCPATPLDRLALPPVGDPTPDRQVLVGFRLADGSKTGSLDGVRIIYTAAGRSYQAFLPNALHVTLPGAAAQS